MIKHIKFIHQLFAIMKKNNLSYERVIEAANSIKPEIVDVKNEISAQDLQRYDKLLKEKLIKVMAEKFTEYRFYHKNFWLDVEDQTFKDGIYQSEVLLEDTIKKLNRWTIGNYFTGDYIGLSKELKIPVNIDGDTIFENISLSTISIKNLYFSTHFIRIDPTDRRPVFEKSMGWQITKNLYKKDFSLLMLAAFYGCDDFIETLIKKGCDINYREPLENKTALDYYTGNKESNPARIAYIKSLLDGTYKDGYYQKMYEEKKLAKTHVSNTQKDTSEGISAYGLYTDLLQEISKKINYLKNIDLPLDTANLRDNVFQETFNQLVQKSIEELAIKENGGIMDPNLKETIDYLNRAISNTMESLGENGLNDSHKNTKIIKQYLVKNGL